MGDEGNRGVGDDDLKGLGVRMKVTLFKEGNPDALVCN